MAFYKVVIKMKRKIFLFTIIIFLILLGIIITRVLSEYRVSVFVEATIAFLFGIFVGVGIIYTFQVKME